MNVCDKYELKSAGGVDFPRLAGSVKITLHNPTTGKNEVIEGHNAPTNALADIFAGNYGGLVNYQNFADIYKTWAGGVLVFKEALDPTIPANYGIPDRVTNEIVAHAGQTPLTSQADDTTRGDPNDVGTVLQADSTKLVFEWSTSQGNAQKISALGLTHTDVGSYGAGVLSEAQKSLVPFVDVGSISRTYEYGDNAVTPFAIDKTNNVAYGFYYSSETTVDIFVTPINATKFKLQGGALLPLSDYTTKTTVTIPTCSRHSAGDCYYHFDLTAGTLTLWRVATEGGATLLQDVINLSTFAVTSSSITVTGVKLWKHRTYQSLSGSNRNIEIPTQAIVYDNKVYVYAYSSDNKRPDEMYSINLANTADIGTITVPDGFIFTNVENSTTARRNTTLGGLIINDSFILNGGSIYPTTWAQAQYSKNYCNAFNNIITPTIGVNVNTSMVSVCKLYLATKYNLAEPIQKTAAQSMTVEYTLTEV